jgi:hypothetical protein
MRSIIRISLLAIAAAAAAGEAAETIQYHEVKLDSSGRLAPWYGAGPSQAYDFVIRRVFEFWLNMRACPNGVPYYLQHQVWKPDQDDARGLGGDQIPMALSSWNLLYGYTGDERVRANMTLMADYWLAHGMSRPQDQWPNLPFPYNTTVHSGVYDGDMRAGRGYLQPDKAASFGSELVMLYKMTGEAKYLEAAVAMADALAAKIRPGDGDNSPWPYRVNASTGEVHRQMHEGKVSTASYTSNYTGALRLFTDLAALSQGNTRDYARARRLLIEWLKAWPIKTNKWGPFFEDIPTSAWSDTEINADTMAHYILEHPEWDANWKAVVKRILDWSYGSFANKEYLKYGVVAIDEQTAYRVPGNSHTSRHASVELEWCEKTGECASKEDAMQRLNWATYTVDSDGKNRYIRDDNWLTDGYGDYVRHFLRAMAAAPELAPGDQNHLLRTSSAIQSIRYVADRIRYTKFDRASRERFKMGAWTPAAVTGGTMQFDPKTRVLEVQATEKTVEIRP